MNGAQSLSKNVTVRRLCARLMRGELLLDSKDKLSSGGGKSNFSNQLDSFHVVGQL